MVAVKTGFTPPPMPGMPAPMQPMGGMPPMPPMGGGALAPNPFAPLPPMPLAGMPPPPMMQPPMQPPMARPPMPQQVPQQQQQGSNANRRRKFGDSLEGMLGRNQGLGATAQRQRPLPMPPQMMPQQRMVAPGTPMMRTPTPRPMEMGGEVDIFGYEDGGSVQYFDEGGHAHPHSDVANSYIENMLAGRDDLTPLEKLDFANTLAADFGVEGGVGHTAAINNVLDIALDINAGLTDQQMLDYLTAAGDASGTYETGLINSLTSNISAAAPAPAPAPAPEPELNSQPAPEPVLSQIPPDPPAAPVAQPYDPDRTIAVGSNSDIDDAFNSGDVVLKDVTIKDGIYMMPDGVTPLTYAAGSPMPTAASTPAPATATTGINAGPGTAVGAPANFGTGAYTPSPVDPSEINAIDYTKLTGDIGNFSGTPESSALFGPKINIPQSVSQYYTDPTTGGLTTTYGPEMVATSPIGAIKLPARPVDIDIFDFLSSPTYGTMYSGSGETRETCAAKGMGYNSILKVCVPMSGDASYGTGSELNTGFLSAPQPMAMGGAVPRQTNIAGQPHMLSYINQDEEALLRSFGGSGIAGPGGIPSYPPSEYSAGQGSGYTTGTGSSNFDSGYTSSAAKRRKKKQKQQQLAAEKAAAIQQIKDAEAAALAAQQTPSGKMDFGDEDYTPTSAALNQQISAGGGTNITSDTSNVNFGTTSSGKDYDTAAQADTDVSGAEYVALTSGSPAPVTGGDVDIFTPTLGSEEVTTTYTDMLGNTHSSAADRDKANLGIQQQMYGSGNQAARNVQQELYKQYAERFPEGKRMEGDSEKLGQMAADAYLEYAPQINELLGPQGLPNQPFNLPFSFSGIEGITPRGSEDSPDQSSQVDVDQSGVGLPSGLILPSEQDIGLGPSGTGNQFNLPTGGPGTFGSTGLPPAPPSPAPDFVTGTSGGGSSTDPDQFPVEKIQSMFPPKDDKDKDKPTKQITEYTDKDGNTTVDNPKTPQNEAMLAQLGLTESLASGRDIQTPNAAESAFLMEALGQMEFNDDGKLVGANPNFLEQVFGKIIKNLTFNMYDPNDPQKGEDAKAILDAYQKTGKFVYDGKEMSLEDLTNRYSGKKGDPDYKNLQAGLEPAVIGVKGADGSTVGFDDGTGFRNIMGDYNPVYSEDGQVFSGGSDTQNILTGSTDVFGGNTNTGNTATEITTGGGDDDTTDGPDLGHTVDEDGNKVCNTEGYVYNPETKICEPKKETDDDDKDLTIDVVRGEDFDNVLKRVVVAAPDVAPISANVQPMQEGGMAGLNRAADNFLQALAG